MLSSGCNVRATAAAGSSCSPPALIASSLILCPKVLVEKRVEDGIETGADQSNQDDPIVPDVGHHLEDVDWQPGREEDQADGEKQPAVSE